MMDVGGCKISFWQEDALIIAHLCFAVAILCKLIQVFALSIRYNVKNKVYICLWPTNQSISFLQHCMHFLQMKVQIRVIFTIILVGNSLTATYPPVWVTNSYVQAGNNQIISSLTGNNLTPTFTFVFGANFTGIPNLGYGIKKYAGNDYFGEEKFQVNRTALTVSTFSVAVQILGFTNIWVMNVPFIAIDPLFPHHLNSFDNVPVNYGAGALVNITVQNSVSTTYYTNSINYTQQVGSSSSYNTFLTPYSRNKVLLFMTSMFAVGNNQNSPPATVDGGPPFNPLDFRVDAYVISVDLYKISVSLSIKIRFQKLHFSMIIFDEQDVESTGLYMLVYQRISFTDAGGFIPIPFQFQDNFIMGFTDFSSIRTKCAVHFEWYFTTVSGVEGVQMPVSVGRSPAGFVLNRVGFTMFYMKTWICPNQTFFDPTQNLCTGCPIYNCLNCVNYRVCGTCDTANGYTLNPVTFQCDGGQCTDCDKWKVERDSCNSLVITISKELYDTPTNIVISNPGIVITNFHEETNSLIIYAQYNEDLLNVKIDLSISTTFSKQLPYNPITPSVLYSNQQCQAMENISRLMAAIQVISYVILIISLISLKIVGLELFGVLQLSYFTLMSHSYFDLYLSPLSKFRSFNGLNVKLFEETAPLPDSIKSLEMYRGFLNNFNVMFFVILLILTVALVLYLVGKYMGKQKAGDASVILLKQGMITLIMFNIFNVSFSAGVQWKYNDQDPNGWANNLIIVLCLLGVLAALAYMELSTMSSQYGQFKLKFKNTWICRLYITFSIAYRICLGFYSAVQNDYQESTLFILAFSIIFIMYNMINLPFSEALQNYRACLCHITQLVILLTTNYYRSMKSNTPMIVKAHIHTPAIIEIVMITLCVFMGLGVLVKKIWRIIRKFKSGRVVKDGPDHGRRRSNIQEVTENSIQVLNP